MNKEEFITKAIQAHGEKYDYSKIEYVNIKTNVCIICKIHGDFWQTPATHFQGKGCPACGNISRGMSNRMTKEEFLYKAVKVHGKGTYDYSRVHFIDANTKICIVCPKHGEFMQTPKGHLKGRMCRKCGNVLTGKAQTLSRDDFISKAIAKHGDAYDYSKVIYVNSTTDMDLVCKKHGKFRRRPSDLLNGCGCPKCGWEVTGEKVKLTQEEFLSKAVAVHGEGTYNYSKVNYVGAIGKIRIVCPKHGEFLQGAHSHLQGHGCPMCNYRTLTLDECIERFVKVHGNTYDYSKIKYVDLATKVCIICKIHGEFWKKPNNHIDGQGCPHCYRSYGELFIRNWLIEKNIIYNQQHTYPDLKGINNGLLKFDFYIPYLNLLIEFDGEQHYRPVRFNGMPIKKAIDHFEKAQHNDFAKNKYCEDNGIPLLRISYKEFKHIPKILSENITKYSRAA